MISIDSQIRRINVLCLWLASVQCTSRRVRSTSIVVTTRIYISAISVRQIAIQVIITINIIEIGVVDDINVVARVVVVLVLVEEGPLVVVLVLIA